MPVGVLALSIVRILDSLSRERDPEEKPSLFVVRQRPMARERRGSGASLLAGPSNIARLDFRTFSRIEDFPRPRNADVQGDRKAKRTPPSLFALLHGRSTRSYLRATPTSIESDVRSRSLDPVSPANNENRSHDLVHTDAPLRTHARYAYARRPDAAPDAVGEIRAPHARGRTHVRAANSFKEPRRHRRIPSKVRYRRGSEERRARTLPRRRVPTGAKEKERCPPLEGGLHRELVARVPTCSAGRSTITSRRSRERGRETEVTSRREERHARCRRRRCLSPSWLAPSSFFSSFFLLTWLLAYVCAAPHSILRRRPALSSGRRFSRPDSHGARRVSRDDRGRASPRSGWSREGHGTRGAPRPTSCRSRPSAPGSRQTRTSRPAPLRGLGD